MNLATSSDVRREHRKAGALNELLAPCAFVSDTTVLTKRGDLFSVLRVVGIDPECREPGDLVLESHRFEAALRILGPEYRVYQYILKRTGPDIPSGASPDYLVNRRAEWMEGRRSQLYSIDLFIVILRTSQLEERGAAGVMSRFSIRQALAVSQSELKRGIAQLEMAIHSLSVQLHDALRPEVLDRQGTLYFLRRLVNYTPSKAEVHGSVQDFHVDQQIASSTVECWPRHLKQGDQIIGLLSMVEPPAQTFPHLLRGLLAVPSNLVICSEWKREANHIVRREIDKKRRHYHLAKSSMLSYVGNSNPRQDEVLLDDSKTAVVDELNQALREIEVNENHFGRFALIVAVYHQDETVLRHALAKVNETFATHDARMVEETYNMLNAWLAMVPGNYAYSLRPMWLLNRNQADMAFLYAPFEGKRENAHLRRQCLAVVETREQTPYFLNVHYGDVGHTSIVGATGSGKSFLLNFLVSSYQQYEPHTVIFDLGGSYRAITSHYGGSYLHVGKQNDFTINPFSLAPTVENLDFLFSFVRVLIERGNNSMTPDERKDLHRAIVDLYALDPDVRTLSTLAQTCRRSYSRRLDEFVGQGRLSGYFDHVEDNLTLSNFQAFDFEGMDQPDVLEPLLFYILHRTNAAIYDPSRHTIPKLVVFDEAWRFFRNPITKSYIHEALKTWRKRNAAMFLATQSGDDLMRSEMLSVVAESCMTKIFLASPGMDEAAYREAFKLNATEAAQIAQLIPRRQFLIKDPDMAKVLNLYVDADALRIFGNQGVSA